MSLHPKFSAFIDKISTTQQDINEALEHLFFHRGMAGIDFDKGTKKIIDPRHQEGCIMIASTQGKNPLTYVEVSPHSSQKIIWQVCMLPRQKERTLIKNIFVDNEKVGQPVATQQAHEIVSFINDLRTTADLWSQSRIIDLEVMPEGVIDQQTTQLDLPVEIEETTFEELFAYAKHVDDTPAHPAIDIRLLIAQGNTSITATPLTELEIEALQVASNMLYQEVVNSSTPNFLPAVQRILEILKRDNAQPYFMSVFLSVVVEKIDEITANQSSSSS